MMDDLPEYLKMRDQRHRNRILARLAEDRAEETERQRRAETPTNQERLLDHLNEATGWEQVRDALVFFLQMERVQ